MMFIAEPDQSIESEHIPVQSQYSDEGQARSQCFFDCLPVELLQKIFSYFSHHELGNYVAPVCQRWRDLAYDPIHWQTIVLEIKESPELEIFEKLFHRTVLLKRLVVNSKTNLLLSVNFFQVFDIDLPHLKELHLTFFEKLDTEVLELLIRNIPCLEILNIEGCTSVDDDCLKAVCQFSSLKSLNISHCNQITDDGIIEFAKGVKYLDSLNIDGIIHISERSVKCLVEMHFKHLRHLVLDGEDLLDLKFISCCINLQTFKVSYAENLDDGLLFSLMKLSNLEVLKLRKGEHFTRAALVSLFAHSSIKKVTYLDLSECTKVNDDVVNAICSRYGSTLRHLDLSWCWEVTDTGLEKIITSCRTLTHLYLLGLNTITGSCLHNIPDFTPFLIFLDLTRCNEIVDSMVVEVVKRKPDLRALDYYGQYHEVHHRASDNLEAATQ